MLAVIESGADRVVDGCEPRIVLTNIAWINCYRTRPNFLRGVCHIPKWRASVVLLFCLLSMIALFARGAHTSQSAIRVKVDLVLVDVVVSDPKGNTVNGLRAENFELLDEAKPQQVVHLSQDEIPLAIALVVDVSSSMDPIIGPLRNGLTRALPSLKPEDRVALFTFAEGVRIELPLIRDRDKIVKRIAGLQVGGLTNLNGAIHEATYYLRSRAPQGRPVIVLVSDHGDNSQEIPGSMPAVVVEKKLLESEIALFSIHVVWHLRQTRALAQEACPPKEAAPWSVDVYKLAADSGGFIVDVHKPESVQSAVESLFQILKTRYTLGFYPNPPGEPGSIRRIEVRLKNDQIERILPGAFLNFRSRYRVPPGNRK